jgi:hypothetical protein
LARLATWRRVLRNQYVLISEKRDGKDIIPHISSASLAIPRERPKEREFGRNLPRIVNISGQTFEELDGEYDLILGQLVRMIYDPEKRRIR